MNRRPILAGNWKMNLLTGEAAALATALAEKVGVVQDRDVVLIPTFVSLAAVKAKIAGTSIGLGAQNGHAEAGGAFTGEIAMPMIADAGCTYVVIGHSERRQFFGETSATCNAKIRAALAAGLTPIYCIGETLEQREAEQTFDVIKAQVVDGLAGYSADELTTLVLAYEPVWAIGTGKTASPEQAQEVHAFIRNLVRESFGDALADGVRIQYGGSVKAGNVDELMAKPDIDGALVGGAALNADGFARIVQFE
jgi:triosephosphate isomerase (TIM)